MDIGNSMARQTFRSDIKFAAIVTGAFFVRNAVVLIGLLIAVIATLFR